MGRKEGVPHLDHRLQRRHASVDAAADMRTRHPAAHEWRAQPGSACVDVSVFVFSDGTFFVALGLSPRWHRCAATAVRFGHTHREEDLRFKLFLKMELFYCTFCHRVFDFKVTILQKKNVIRRGPKRVSNIDRCHKRRPVLFMEIKCTCEGAKPTLI